MVNTLVRMDGLDEVRAALGRSGRVSRKAARLAINDTARKIRTASSKAVRDQVNLKAAYVNRHLRLTQRATDSELAAVISARTRPTRLARYGAKQLTRKAPRATGDPSRNIPAGRKQAGVSVKVQKGGARRKMRGAFLIPLQSAGVEGVFVRTGSGDSDIEHLYGPSVDQVFQDVREDVAPDTETMLAREFRRQLKRLL